jgi:small subunit ribosomal protein S20
MPHTPSAKKRLRQNEVRRIRNQSRMTEIKTIRKQFLRALHDGLKPEAERIYRELSRRLDQAASLNTIHRNAAARVKSRLATKISSLAAPAAKPT